MRTRKVPKSVWAVIEREELSTDAILDNVVLFPTKQEAIDDREIEGGGDVGERFYVVELITREIITRQPYFKSEKVK